MSLQEAGRLAKLRQYEEALPLFRAAYQADEQQFKEWEFYYYIQSLRKTGRLSEAIGLYRDVHKRYPQHEQNKNQYAWCLYDMYVKPTKEQKIDEPNMLKAAAYITKATAQSMYTPYERTVFAVLKHMNGKNKNKSKDSVSWSQLLGWLDKLDDTLLSNEPTAYTDGEGNDRELSSPLEDWHKYKVFALYGLQQWGDCIQASDEALRAIPKFHSNNQIWIGMKRALSQGNLGDVQGAIERLEQLAKQSEHWIVYDELFRLYRQTGDERKALENGACAMLSRSGEYKHKVNVLNELGAMLEETGQLAEALRHYALLRDVRAENGWPVTERLASAIDRLERQTEGSVSVSGYKKTLETFWTTAKLSALKQGKGAITKLNADGKSGFIKGDDHESVYFRAQQFKGPRHRFAVGQRVSFYAADSFDHKKQKMSKQAVEIRPI